MMNTLPNIENASNLGSIEKDALLALLNVYRTVLSRNAKLKSYYESDVEPSSIGIDVVPDGVNVAANCDWPRKAVTSVSERCRFDGFVFNGEYQDDGLEHIMQDNAFKMAFNLNLPSELIHGCMFGTVGTYNGKTIMRMHTAETAAGTWDVARGQLGSGFVIADMQRTSWSPNTPVPTQLNMHLPGEVVIFNQIASGKWTAKAMSTPLERPMMEAFAYRATGLKPFGQSRITKTVMSLTDEVIRTLQYMAVSSAFFAAPQKYLLGLTDEQFDAIQKNKWATYIGNLLLSTSDGDGNTPQFGQLSPASPQPYIDILRTYAMLFSGATGVPLNSLGIIQDNPSSAQAIEASKEDIIVAADDLIASNKDGLRMMALMAMAVDNNVSIDALTPEQMSVTAHFADPSIPSIVGLADAMVKVASVAPWLSESEVFLEYLGFGEADRRRLMADKAKAQANTLLASALNGIGTEIVDDEDTA